MHMPRSSQNINMLLPHRLVKPLANIYIFSLFYAKVSGRDKEFYEVITAFRVLLLECLLIVVYGFRYYVPKLNGPCFLASTI